MLFEKVRQVEHRSNLYPAQELKRRTLAWAVKLRVNPRVIRVQKMRRKWGSCSSRGIITLASDLVDEERRFQDFVHIPGWPSISVSRGSRGA